MFIGNKDNAVLNEIGKRLEKKEHAEIFSVYFVSLMNKMKSIKQNRNLYKMYKMLLSRTLPFKMIKC